MSAEVKQHEWLCSCGSDLPLLTVAGKLTLSYGNPFERILFHIIFVRHSQNHGGKTTDVVSVVNLTCQSEFVRERMTDAFWYNNMATALSLTKTDLQDC